MLLTVFLTHSGSPSRWAALVHYWFAFLDDDVHAGQDEELYDTGDLNNDVLRPEDLNSEEYERTYDLCE